MALPSWAKVSAAILAGLAIYNGLVTIPVALARKDESGVTMVAYRRWLVDPTTTVIDIWHVSGEASMADVDRNLFLAADGLKGQHFSAVELAYHRSGRFLISGDKFNEIGKQWRSQSVMYLINSVASGATDLAGKPAFGRWEGGWLGVMMKQMQDHNQLHWAWYLAEMSGADPNSAFPDKDNAAPTGL
jgi:hypothetical protein